MYKKTTAILTFLFLLSIASPFATSIKAEEVDYDAESVILLEAETGQVLYESNANEPMSPASLTKIMTLVLGLEALEEGELDLEDKVRISENAQIPFDGTQSVMGFDRVGQEVKLKDIITGIAVVSANDGCIALAEHMKGSEDRFVRAMNEKAEDIGLENTSFANSHGLDDPDQYMSARDVANLSKYAVNNTPKILELESMDEFTFNDITQPNRNLMLPGKSYGYDGVDGLKTGRTADAGFSFVGTALRGDMRLIAVVMKAPDKPTRFESARNLFDYGFDNFDKLNLYESGEIVGEAPVIQGTEHFVPLATKERLAVVTDIQDQADLDHKLEYNEEIKAPVEQGEKLGELHIYDGDESIGSVAVEAAETIEELGFFGKILRGISNFFSNLWESIIDSITGLF